jgi:hypothetical protein
MRISWRSFAGGSMVLALLVGCSSKNSSLGDDPGDDSGGGSGSGSGGMSFGSPGSSSGSFSQDGGPGNVGTPGDCRGGFYEGQFGGLYSSHITLFGINIPVTGDVRLTLQQMGDGTQMCTFEGESEKCSDIFSVQNGSISGVADAIHTGDASFAGFPYYCTLTGTLGCMQKKLVDGWIECTYCLGDLADGGMSCVNGDGVGGTIGTGGQFAGPLTADYFTGGLDGGSAPSFGTEPPMIGPDPGGMDPGAWNGAESLSDQHGNFYSGMGALPDGGMLYDYIQDAGYGKIGAMNDFGGDGWWYAVWQHN